MLNDITIIFGSMHVLLLVNVKLETTYCSFFFKTCIFSSLSHSLSIVILKLVVVSGYSVYEGNY